MTNTIKFEFYDYCGEKIATIKDKDFELKYIKNDIERCYDYLLNQTPKSELKNILMNFNDEWSVGIKNIEIDLAIIFNEIYKKNS